MPAEHNFDRRKGESDEAFAAFREYLDLGPSRAFPGVARRCGKSVSLIARWSARHDWVDRASAYDDHLAELENAHRRMLAEEAAAEWLVREKALRDRRYAIAVKMLDRVEQMLNFPLTTVEKKTNEDGSSVTILKPAKWNMNTARLLAQTASELAVISIRNEESRNEADENGAVYEFNNTEYIAPKK